MNGNLIVSRRLAVILLTSCILLAFGQENLTRHRHRRRVRQYETKHLNIPDSPHQRHGRRLGGTSDKSPKKQKQKKKQDKQNKNKKKKKSAQATATSTTPKTPLSVLALGGSVTYGAMLPNPAKQSYPYLLSPPHWVDNLAIRATGADYPSKCIESMIGDKKYDVILLEFTLNGTPGLDLLLKRLRKRFPHAIFLYVHLYSLCIETRDESGKSPFERGDRDDSVKYYWNAKKRATDDFLERVVRKLITGVGGHVYEFPRFYPPMDGLELFSSDWHHLSQAGHQRVADDLKKMIDKLIPQYQRDKPLGSWGQGDECRSWFYNGKIPFKYTGARIFKISDVKWTLEFFEQGTINIMNHKGHPIPMYLSFMTWWSNYPVTEVRLLKNNNGGDGEGDEVTVVDPRNTKIPHHITRMQLVGKAKPGMNVVKFIVKSKAQLPFRLTSVVLCGVCGEDDLERGNTVI